MNLVEKLLRNKLTNSVAIERAIRCAHQHKSREELIAIIKLAHSETDLLLNLSTHYCTKYFNINYTNCQNASDCKVCWQRVIQLYRKD